jgi:tetratricopeptide (TPR) repeat protein
MRAVTAAIALAAVVTIGGVRQRLADSYATVKVNSDVYPLPPPSVLVAASLGHRSALADLIFSHLLVAYGIHAQEKRRLEFGAAYLDAINALDPKFRDPYRFADTILVFGPTPPKEEDYRKARQVYERGLQNLPYDTELWLTAAQYILYLGAPRMPASEQAAWKVDGAKMLARACELASANSAIPYHCIKAAALLERAGEREASIQSLQRLIAVNDDPEIEAMALAYLASKVSERDKERQEHRRDVFRTAWKGDLPFVTKDMMLVVGPRADVARCAGRALPADALCATSWAAWAAIADPVIEN